MRAAVFGQLILLLLFQSSDGKRVEDVLYEEILWSSLASNRVQACDGERVTLHCPRHTHIHVDTGFYGRVVPPSELCPNRQPASGASSPFAPALGCDVIHAKSVRLY
ncbi:unnamed protein product, partial [Mesorhabditis spiculigera]